MGHPEQEKIRAVLRGSPFQSTNVNAVSQTLPSVPSRGLLPDYSGAFGGETKTSLRHHKRSTSSNLKKTRLPEICTE